MKLKIIDYVKTWENRGYKDGIPDEAPIMLEQLCKVPSYRKIVMAILKNDNNLQSLGYTPKKSIYYNILKKIEIDARTEEHPKYKKKNIDIQLKLF